MSAVVVVALATLLVVLDLLRVFAQRGTLTRTGMLIGAMAHAAIPVATAIAVGIWQLIAAFDHIAESGHGGLQAVAIASIELQRSLLNCVIGFAVVLLLALLLAMKVRGTQGLAAAATPRRAVATTIGIMLVLGSHSAIPSPPARYNAAIAMTGRAWQLTSGTAPVLVGAAVWHLWQRTSGAGWLRRVLAG